jgi:hypothetical protein
MAQSVALKRICGWCNRLIDEGTADGAVTWGICEFCKSTLEGQISEVERLQSEYAGRFPCINCPRDGFPYRLVDNGHRRSLYLRCSGCGVRWIMEV